MRVAIIMRRNEQGRPRPVTGEMLSLLRLWGCQVDTLLPDEEHLLLSAGLLPCDLVILESATPAALSLAGAYHAHGVRVVNAYPSAVACRDKVVATRTLRQAGLPVPETWVTTRPADLAAALRGGTLLIRPSVGQQGPPVRIVRTADEFPPERPGRPPYLVQRFRPATGPEFKVHCIGGDVFCVPHDAGLSTRPALSARLRDFADTARTAFGVDLFELDVVFSEDRPYITDVCTTPDFTGVPDAGLRLAEFLYATARSVGPPPATTAATATAATTSATAAAASGTVAFAGERP